MYYNKRSIKLFTALMASLIVSCMTSYKTRAVEAPTDIHLTVETKEIAIDDVPDDRVVTLNINQENCPYFDSIRFFVTKDPRIEFFPTDKCFSIPDSVKNARTPGIGYFNLDSDDRICNLLSYIGDEYLIEFDDTIATVTFMLPEQLFVGDFFNVELPRYLGDTPTQINLTKSREYSFVDSCFTQLNGGGIRIVDKEQPMPPGDDSGGGSDSDINDNGGGHDSGIQDNGGVQNIGGEQHNNHNSDSQEITTAVTSVTVTETKAILTSGAVISTTKNTTTKSTSMISTESTTEMTMSATTTTDAFNDSGKKNGLIIIGIFTLIAAVVSALTVLASKLKVIKRNKK